MGYQVSDWKVLDMKCWGMWWGGSSYAAPSAWERDDVEEFSSLSAAKEEFEDRYSNIDRRTPAVSESAEMQIFFEDPYQNHDPYPDRLLTIGPRGGTRMEVIG